MYNRYLVVAMYALKSNVRSFNYNSMNPDIAGDIECHETVTPLRLLLLQKTGRIYGQGDIKGWPVC